MSAEVFPQCKGTQCSDGYGCMLKGRCLYKPSADEAREAMAKGTVEDFAGKIDGGGVKGVMKEPKCPVDQIPPQFLEGVAEVLKFGMKKYAKLNWMRGMSFETVLGGVVRHVLAIRRGEEFDPETGLPHAYHASCGLMFISWYLHGPNAAAYRNGKDGDGNPLDDRVFKNLNPDK